jgi:hypothetical protein
MLNLAEPIKSFKKTLLVYVSLFLRLPSYLDNIIKRKLYLYQSITTTFSIAPEYFLGGLYKFRRRLDTSTDIEDTTIASAASQGGKTNLVQG